MNEMLKNEIHHFWDAVRAPCSNPKMVLSSGFLDACTDAAVGIAVAGVAAAGWVACENDVKEKVSIKAKQKSIFLEIELWLPTFFI